jgi:NADH:ubiquinone oxidoreductase subunit 6 (subunit J)
MSTSDQHIDKIESLIKKVLNKELIDKLKNKKIKDFKNKKTEEELIFFSKLSKNLKEIIDCFCFSILSGEYILIPHYEKDYLEKIKEQTTTLPSIEFKDLREGDPECSDINNRINRTFTDPIISVCNLIHLFNTDIKETYSNLNHDIIFHKLDEKIEKSLEYIRRMPQSVGDIVLSLRLCIHIAVLDHTLSYDKEFQKDLFSIKDKIENSNNYKNKDEISKILFDKCNALILKIYTKARIEGDEMTIKTNFIEEKFKPDDDSNSAYKIFNNKTVEYHPIKEKDFRRFRNIVNEVENRYQEESPKHKEATYEDFYLLAHYYRKILEDGGKLKSLCEIFDKKLSPETNGFDTSAYKISRNYIHNNLFSYQVKQEKFDYKFTEKYFKEVTSIHKDDDCNSYYPFYKYLKTLNSQIGKVDDDLDLLNTLLARQKELLKILVEKHSKFYKHSFSIYQLPINDCIIKPIINGKYVKLFLASSFTIPNNFGKEKKSIEDIKDSIYDKYLTQISKYTNDNTQKHQEAFEELNKTQKDIEKNTTRSIELVSILSIVIALVAGSISTIKNSNIEEALLTFIVVSAVMSLFLGLIISLTKSFADNTWSKKIGNCVMILSTIALIASITIICFKSYKPINHYTKKTTSSHFSKSIKTTTILPKSK